MLAEELDRSGNWLFRHRGFLPLLMLLLLAVAMRKFHLPNDSHTLDECWEGVCLGVSLLGFAIRVITTGCTPKGTSGRNTREQKARSLNVTGMYSVVRNPLYLGNFFIALGIAMFPRVLWLPVFYAMAFWLYYERIIFAEEQFLRMTFGAEFEEWARRTPAFFPRLWKWRKSAVPFSLRTVLRREYSTFFVLIAAMFALEEAGALISTGELELDVAWIILASLAVVQYVVLRTIKKRTRLLHLPGR